MENTSVPSSSSSNSLPIWSSRPLSLPEPSRSGPPRIYSPTPRRPSAMPDRNSTASLPLPAHTPYHLLPHLSDLTQEEDFEMPDDGTQASGSRTSYAPYRTTSPGIPSSGPRYMRGTSFGFDRIFDRNVSPQPGQSDHDMSPVTPDNASHHSIPPPQPPIVLTPPPPPLGLESSMHAPHEPFLAHSPAPHDSYLAVETSAREYRLVARLPGFRRDAMCVFRIWLRVSPAC